MESTYPTLGQILPDLSLQNALTFSVGPLVLDSRQVTAGDTFVALGGTQVDGASFIDSAVKQGAALILAEGLQEDCESLADGVHKVVVPALREKLSAMAGRWYSNPSQTMNVVGITGTNGKTTCSHWLAELLADPQSPAGSVGTLGYGLTGEPMTVTGMTTPDAIQTQAILSQLHADGAKSVVMEVSSHSLDQHRVAGVAFDVAVLTNLGRDHLDYHGDMDRYVASKAQLMQFESLKAAVLNVDDPYVEVFKAALAPSVKMLSYGLREQADFSFQQIQYSPAGVKAILVTPEGDFDVALPVWGEFNLHNILAVVASGYALGRSVAMWVQRLPDLPSVAGRLERVDVDADITVLVDFAHTADALQSVLSAIRQHSTQRLWCVFGCGGDRDKGKRPLMAAVAEAVADHVVVTSDNPRMEEPQSIIDEVMAGFRTTAGVECIADREAAIRHAIVNAKAGDCIVLAGKGHENYQQIGAEKIPFSDVTVARLALQSRAEQLNESGVVKGDDVVKKSVTVKDSGSVKGVERD
ncbi:UDP-N-acetylmuramoyl-L-alanyl-D-glutamate--2,6-diaminopimelate ligase [Aestuariicella hydrocarbonica]|uniref:UDP-N-acetylmuramoyl-L-alanyl-D-glutamate--2,6-diaminopimelate ligase n=1 Tax=Pseudomaricurvus hydrocarbonicus TaxID=1470433 RepID=A0A9E5MLZ6_9GAMM|nr:UDP-N-acetylmuramoyl-L-alanyl-D-glutamate--2,6-diaminopimelate ligase [Aestuariicella hydrocarbonica]NHO65075.1 UDP-N-acetylmuramoyl-L-alanyl-D-glutamate--2,6-diaminopimelate ligase [Aestuariicella hydrocarbonica]